MSSSGFIFASLLPLLAAPATAPESSDLLILIPALSLISFCAAGFAVWAFRRIHLQHARAELLAKHLHQMREETHRRLNFLNAISHDLRTPLNGITLQTHIMDRAVQSDDHPMIQHAATEVRSSATLAAEILDALLQYARIDLDDNVITPVNLRELLQGAAEPFRAAAEDKHLAFTFAVDEDLTLHTDRAKLQRIVANLLDNAVKFTHNGSIILRAGRGQGPSPLAGDGSMLALFADRWPRGTEHCVIEVADTGEGIAPEHRDKVFREFFQAHNPSRDARLGLGLGLVIAERLAHQLGGSLSCTSELRQGTRMILQLPVTAPELVDADSGIPHPSSAPLHRTGELHAS
jgi:signal transduction histidine kinase